MKAVLVRIKAIKPGEQPICVEARCDVDAWHDDFNRAMAVMTGRGWKCTIELVLLHEEERTA